MPVSRTRSRDRLSALALDLDLEVFHIPVKPAAPSPGELPHHSNPTKARKRRLYRGKREATALSGAAVNADAVTTLMHRPFVVVGCSLNRLVVAG